jgi:hypothetical protein
MRCATAPRPAPSLVAPVVRCSAIHAHCHRSQAFCVLGYFMIDSLGTSTEPLLSTDTSSEALPSVAGDALASVGDGMHPELSLHCGQYALRSVRQRRPGPQESIVQGPRGSASQNPAKQTRPALLQSKAVHATFRVSEETAVDMSRSPPSPLPSSFDVQPTTARNPKSRKTLRDRMWLPYARSVPSPLIRRKSSLDKSPLEKHPYLDGPLLAVLFDGTGLSVVGLLVTSGNV